VAVSQEVPHLRLGDQSRRLQRPMVDLAEAIIIGEEMGRM